MYKYATSFAWCYIIIVLLQTAVVNRIKTNDCIRHSRFAPSTCLSRWDIAAVCRLRLTDEKCLVLRCRRRRRRGLLCEDNLRIKIDVVLSKRSAPKDLRTKLTANVTINAKILRVAALPQDDTFLYCRALNDRLRRAAAVNTHVRWAIISFARTRPVTLLLH